MTIYSRAKESHFFQKILPGSLKKPFEFCFLILETFRKNWETLPTCSMLFASLPSHLWPGLPDIAFSGLEQHLSIFELVKYFLALFYKHIQRITIILSLQMWIDPISTNQLKRTFTKLSHLTHAIFIVSSSENYASLEEVTEVAAAYVVKQSISLISRQCQFRYKNQPEQL